MFTVIANNVKTPYAIAVINPYRLGLYVDGELYTTYKVVATKETVSREDDAKGIRKDMSIAKDLLEDIAEWCYEIDEIITSHQRQTLIAQLKENILKMEYLAEESKTIIEAIKIKY